MGWRKNNPGCPCCHCEIDQFSASVSISGQTLRSAEHPQSPYPTWLQAEVYSAGPDPYQLLLNWDDATPGDGLYVEVTPEDGAANGTMKLYRKNGSQLGNTLELLCAIQQQWHRITICYDPDTSDFTACLDAADDDGYVVAGQCVTATVPIDFITAAGRKAGYDGTSASIRNYKYERLWYCGEKPYRTDCHADIDGDGEYDYYYDVPERSWCHRCGSPSCTVVDNDFSVLDDGDMPCGWDAGGTNWQVLDGAATGDGPVCHKLDTSLGQYNAYATFALGHLETLSDFVRVEISIGSDYEYLKVTRVAGEYAWMPDRLKYESSRNGTSYVALTDGTATLWVCYDGTQTGDICVSITQPTLSGHEDASLMRFIVRKSRFMDENCPACPSNITCLSSCQDAQTAQYYKVTLSLTGTDCISGKVCRCSDYNGTHILGPDIAIGGMPVTGCYRGKFVFMPCEIKPGIWYPETTPGTIVLGFSYLAGPPLAYQASIYVTLNHATHLIFYKNFTDPIDCLNFNDVLSGGVRVTAI